MPRTGRPKDMKLVLYGICCGLVWDLTWPCAKTKICRYSIRVRIAKHGAFELEFFYLDQIFFFLIILELALPQVLTVTIRPLL